MPTKGNLNLSPSEAWHNFTHPGIEMSTPNEIKIYAASKMEAIMGAKTSLIAGNYFSTNLGVTNKVYAMEYGQWYPGYKIDVDGVSKKWSFLNAHYAAYKQTTYLNQLQAIQSDFNVAVQQMHACENKLYAAQNDFGCVNARTYMNNLDTAMNQLALAQNNVEVKKNQAFTEQSAIVAKVTESNLEQARARLIAGDIQVQNNKLLML